MNSEPIEEEVKHEESQQSKDLFLVLQLILVDNNLESLQIIPPDGLAQDDLSEGLQDGDPMLLDADPGYQNDNNHEDSSGSDYNSAGENEEEEGEQDGVNWEEILGNWHPNWLGEYARVAGPSADIPQDLNTAGEYFRLFYDDEVLDLIVTETNRYSQQYFETHPDQARTDYYKSWTPCTQERIKAYIAIIIHMGLSQYPRMDYHWSKTLMYNCSLCPNVMTKKEFFLLHGFLHYCDNRAANLDDKLYKVRRLFDLLSARFRRFYIPNQNLTIDERIVKYTGRLSFLQYIRNKPNQLGIKVFVVADLTGYTYNWKVYTGRERQNLQRSNQLQEPMHQRRSFIYPTVMELTNNLINQIILSVLILTTHIWML